MSLKQLLPVGKSFLGMRDEKSPFEMPREGVLPIFGNSPRFQPKNEPSAKLHQSQAEPPRQIALPIDPPERRLAEDEAPSGASPVSKPKRSWLSRLTFGLLGKAPTEGNLVQAELKLDKVRVVRNDLREADLELVIRKKKSPVFNPQHAPRARAEQGWSRMAARLFEIGQNH